MLVSLQILAKSFVSNIIIDLSYNLCKHVRKLFEVGCLHQHTVIALYCLDMNGKVGQFFAYPNNNHVFNGPELNLVKSPVCKIIFFSEFPDIPDKAYRKTRRRTQAITKRYAFHANAINNLDLADNDNPAIFLPTFDSFN